MKGCLRALAIFLAGVFAFLGVFLLVMFFNESMYEPRAIEYERLLQEHADIISQAETPCVLILEPFNYDFKSPSTKVLIKMDLPPGKRLKFMLGTRAGTFRFKTVEGDMDRSIFLFRAHVEVKRVIVDGQRLPFE